MPPFSLSLFVALLTAYAIIPPFGFAGCQSQLAQGDINLRPLDELLVFSKEEKAELLTALRSNGALTYEDTPLRDYRRRIFSELNDLNDGNFIALSTVIAQKQFQAGNSTPLKGEGRHLFFERLKEWCELKLSLGHNKKRIAELENTLRSEYIKNNNDPDHVQPLTADLANILNGLENEAEIESSFPRYGLPAFFVVFYKRFLEKPNLNLKPNNSVDEFTRRHFYP